MNFVDVEVKDLYDFLIAECRYGYRRNNHLMPDCAYDHVKKYLTIMLSKDRSWAISTAQQLCEECISDQLMWHFADGFDDEFDNRKKAILFVEYLLTWVHDNGDVNWKPHNFDSYIFNLKKDDEPIYNIYEIEYVPAQQEKLYAGMPTLGAKLNSQPLARKEYINYLFDNIIKVKNGYYNKIRLKDDMCTFVFPEAFRYRFDDLKRSFVIVANGICDGKKGE